MTIHITVSDLDPNIQELYLEDRIRNLCIDYQPNAIVGYIQDVENYKEIEVFNFSRICKMDNRFTSYRIYGRKTEIVVEIVGL
jgi:midasin (ATPase involved in ribosome maturation)